MTECNSHSKQDKKYNEESKIAPAEPASASHECPIDSSEIFNGFSQFETSGASKASKDVTTGTLESVSSAFAINSELTDSSVPTDIDSSLPTDIGSSLPTDIDPEAAETGSDFVFSFSEEAGMLGADMYAMFEDGAETAPADAETTADAAQNLLPSMFELLMFADQQFDDQQFDDQHDDGDDAPNPAPNPAPNATVQSNISASPAAHAAPQPPPPLLPPSLPPTPIGADPRFARRRRHYRGVRRDRMMARQQAILSASPVPGLDLVSNPVEYEGVVYTPDAAEARADAEAEAEILRRSFSEPIPIPKSPHGLRGPRPSPIIRRPAPPTASQLKYVPVEGGEVFNFSFVENPLRAPLYETQLSRSLPREKPTYRMRFSHSLP